MEQIAAYGQVVFRLQKFIDEVMGHSPESIIHGTVSTPKKTTEAPFRTYQAFMWALYKYFISFKEELTEIEKCIINKGTVQGKFYNGAGGAHKEIFIRGKYEKHYADTF